MACCRAKVTHVEHSGVEKIPIPGALFSHMQGCRDRLKPHLGSVAPKANVLPKRGRPRTASVDCMAPCEQELEEIYELYKINPPMIFP